MNRGAIPFRITDRYRVEEVVEKGRLLGERPCVRLLVPIEYRVGHAESGETITAPVGFETDFGSIPWGAWNLFPPHGPWARPAVIHDFLYRTRGTGTLPGDIRRIARAQDYSRREADWIFREAMEVVDVDRWRRRIMYTAVRVGGGCGWGT